MTRRRGTPGTAVSEKAQGISEYALLIAGSFIVAVSFNLFLNPNQIATGGVSGISTILYAKLGFEPAVTQWTANIPLFILGLWMLGGKFGVKTAAGSIILPLFVLLTRHWESPTHNILLATIYGGIGVGVGLGLVFRGRASTGGLDVAAQILHKFTGISLGLALASFDGLVILSAGLLFSWEKALYALIGLYVTSKTIDVVQLGFSVSKVAFIITAKTEEMRSAVLYDLDRGLTRLQGQGGYTGDDRPVLMVVVDQREVSKLKALVRHVDPHAFVIISHTTEVLGEGFKLHN